MPTESYVNPTLSSTEPQFPDPFKGDVPPRTIVEYRMCDLSAILRNRPRWWIDYKNETIAAKWREEAMGLDFDEEQFDYVLAEIDDYARMRDELSGAEAGCFDKIWQSDSLISDDVRDALRAAAHELEDVPDAEKQWRPNSNDQVLDLVNPSLYPLVYGRTLFAPKFEPIEAPTVEHDSDSEYSSYYACLPTSAQSGSFAWLPTDFRIAPDGPSAKAQAYINNIHPSNKPLIHAVEKVVAAFVPLLNRVLTDQLPSNKQHFPIRIPGDYTYDESNYPEMGFDESPNEFDDRVQGWYCDRPVILPELPEFKPGSRLERTETYAINGRTVQIIVKLSSIHLTPEKPKYHGRLWSVEGMQNETIVASGVYCYDAENVSESFLSFRQAVLAPRLCSRATQTVWGLTHDGELAQNVGAVEFKEGRCVCFPNIYQHGVTPFSLIDKKKPGHQKILAIFLVDPSKRIPSTTEVGPQQHEWLTQALDMAMQDENSHVSKLPRELIETIASKVTSTMTRGEAVDYRHELTEERVRYKVLASSHFGMGASFSMCEQ